ncbi:ABC-2 family transporter protein [Desulfonispora thiosulfatigenes DSM 11270]|uniref:ABC-2 family transporter protein n=1 Tax=Desulfonispora thiosulfatigenes DSM 11270 TaxID=656914 RepID=A0A1W1V1C3_DESTI|nr:ABC transporter permease [Desulfonispora thiosulfatigenes]SMB87157.1 ABC-2 family transporter protein [Desulfonispora thiosulfatigenes DSM 11270]
MKAIIKYTLKEMFYKKILVVTLILSLIFFVLYGLGLHFTYQDMVDDLLSRAIISSQLLSAGFYFANFIIVFLTILGSIGLFTSELESGLLYPVLSKPLTRNTYLAGKFIGLALSLILFSIFMIIMVIGLNLYFAKDALINLTFINFAKAMGIYLLIPLTLLAIIFFFSIRLKALATGIIVVIFHVIGLIGGMVEQMGVLLQKQNLINIGIISSLINPVDSMYRKSMSLLYDNSLTSLISVGPFGGSSQPPSTTMVVYAILFTVIFLLLAARRFNKLDL